jgi:hypothetical protein
MGFFFGELILLVILFLILYNRGRDGIQTLRISFGAGKRRSADVSGEDHPVPPELAHSLGVLGELGFLRLGEVQVMLPGGQIALSRIHVSADRTIFAELTEGRIVLLTSVFADDAVVETGFPVGESFDGKKFRSHTVTSDLQAAHAHHRSLLESFRKDHGGPRRMETLRDYLDYEAMYRTEHVARKMRRHTGLGILQAAALLFGILASLAAIVYWMGSDKSTIEPMLFIALWLIAVLTPAAVIAFFLPYIGDRGSRRGSR